ncbi:MAG: YitT family protein [Pseudomonadota bacterium]
MSTEADAKADTGERPPSLSAVSEPAAQTWQATARHHTPLEDAQGIFTGVVMTALGLAILAHLGLLTGGTAGLALIIDYATGWGFGPIFFCLNLPFYGLAISRMGRAFTIKTFAAVASLSVVAAWQPTLFELGSIAPAYGAVLGGLLVGFGLLAMFRHRASLGGVGILAIYLQDRFGWRAGIVQLVIDLMILAASPLVLDGAAIAYSVLGAVVLNVFLAINHRTDRYIAV